MVGFLHRKAARHDTAARLDLDVFAPGSCLAIAVTVFVGQRVFGVVKLLGIDVYDVGIIDRMAPPQILIVAKRGERRPEERGAGHVPPLIAMNVAFVPLTWPEERLVRIDEQ